MTSLDLYDFETESIGYGVPISTVICLMLDGEL